MSLQVAPVAASATPQAATPDTGLDGNSFMTLLVAQLKQQDPTQPQDPAQWIGQLVQFNSLQQLIDINQQLGGLTAPSSVTP